MPCESKILTYLLYISIMSCLSMESIGEFYFSISDILTLYSFQEKGLTPPCIIKTFRKVELFMLSGLSLR